MSSLKKKCSDCQRLRSCQRCWAATTKAGQHLKLSLLMSAAAGLLGALLLDLYVGDGDGGGSGGGSKLHFVFYFSPLTCGGWVWCHC